MIAYKAEILIIDFDDIGEEEIVWLLETTKFPNRAINPIVMKVIEKDIGEWSDDHPLNTSEQFSEYKRLFENKEQE